MEGTSSGTLMEQLQYLQDPTEGLEADLLIVDRGDEVEVPANAVAEEISEDELGLESVEEEQATEYAEESIQEAAAVVESTEESLQEEAIAESTEELLQEKATSEIADGTLLEVESSLSSDEAAVIEEQLELENEVLASLSLTSSVLEQYVWNDANRLISHTNEAGDVTTYRYDGDHNRVYMGTKLGSLDGASDYPSAHALGDRIGWEPQYKKQQTSIYFANEFR